MVDWMSSRDQESGNRLSYLLHMIQVDWRKTRLIVGTGAEKYKAEDQKQQERIAAKNQLEQYAYGVRSTIMEEKTKEKLSADDRKTLEDAIQETLNGLNVMSMLVKKSMIATWVNWKVNASLSLWRSIKGGEGGPAGAGAGADFGGRGAGAELVGASAGAGASGATNCGEVD